jgi:cytochrome b561
MQQTERFGRVAIAIHWTMAAGVLLSVIFGLATVYINDIPVSRKALEIHQTFGIVMLVLAMARLVWRLTHKPPAPLAGLPRGQKIAAFVTHATLYLFLLGLPISGYIGLAARGKPIPVFGLFDLPHVTPRSLDLSANAQSLHYYASFALYALVVLHIGAALYHQFVLKDGLIQRMWPERK